MRFPRQLAIALTIMAAACGSGGTPPASAPTNDGRSDWQIPTLLSFGQANKTDAEQVLTRGQQASIWYGVDVPVDGRLSLIVRIDTAEPAERSHARDPERPFDVAVLVYDNNFTLLERVDERAGSTRKRKHTWPTLARGRYYVHVYLQNELRFAGFELEFELEPTAVANAPASTAPAGTAPASTAPASTAPASTAPASTAPASTAPVNTAPVNTAPVSTAPGTPPPTLPPATPPAIIEARVTRMQSASGGGTIITINRGSKQGIDKDWIGRIQDDRGQLVSKPFKLIKIGAQQSVAKVPLTTDQVKLRPRVLLSPPERTP